MPRNGGKGGRSLSGGEAVPVLRVEPAAPVPSELPTQLPDGGFDFAAMLAIADDLPVMIAFLDTAERFRFANKPLAEWLEKPRSDILGRPLAEVLGAEAYATRAAS
jgi:PAS domain-containing protein